MVREEGNKRRLGGDDARLARVEELNLGGQELAVSLGRYLTSSNKGNAVVVQGAVCLVA